MPTKSTKIGGSTFAYAEQFNYPLSPCYKNTVKEGWHSGGKRTTNDKSDSSKIDGGGIFDWLLGQSDKKKSKSSKSSKSSKDKKKDDKTSEKKKKSKK